MVTHVHMNRLSFTLKLWAESLAFVEKREESLVIYPWSDLNPACIICKICKQPAIDGRSIAAMTNKKYGAVRASTWADSTMAADTALWQ